MKTLTHISMYTKINLDELSFKSIVSLIRDKENLTILFYNGQDGKDLNKEKIFSIIYYIKKYNVDIKYFFYNIPFCLFKIFGDNFVEKHCVKNRLCNYYDGYVSYDKCNECKFGLFCNNFNGNISFEKVKKLDGWYQDTIKKDYLLNIISIYYAFVLSLGYNEEDISFYTTQKYIVELLNGKIDFILKDYLNYLTLYFFVPKNEISLFLFESLKSFSLVFKDKDTENKTITLIKKYGINLNFTTGEGQKILNYDFNNINIRLDYYHSREKNSLDDNFFSFTDICFDEKNTNEFYGKILNPLDMTIITSVNILRKAGDIFKKQSEIFIGRDILSGINLNNYKGILISSDGLGDKGRLVQSLQSIKIPVIYDIYPDLTLMLKDGDSIEINFKTGKISKI